MVIMPKIEKERYSQLHVNMNSKGSLIEKSMDYKNTSFS